MNNSVENKFFGFPKVKWLHLTGEMDKSVRFHVRFSQIYRAKKVDVFGTRCIGE